MVGCSCHTTTRARAPPQPDFSTLSLLTLPSHPTSQTFFRLPPPPIRPPPHLPTTMAAHAFVATVPPPSPITTSPAVSSRVTTTRSRARAGATPIAVRVADGEVLRLGEIMAALAGVGRVPTHVSQGEGMVIGAARIIEQVCSNIRMSVFASGVNNVGDTK